MIVKSSIRQVGPKELALMTGLSPVMQRDWRRAGHLKKGDAGWSSFTIQAVAEIALRKTLADAGLGPAVTKPIFTSPQFAAVVNSIAWWMVEAADWETPSDVADAIDTPAVTRFSLVEQITGVGADAAKILLVFSPSTGTMVLRNEAFTVEEVANGIVQVVVRLDDLGRQAATKATAPLVTIKGLVT